MDDDDFAYLVTFSSLNRQASLDCCAHRLRNVRLSKWRPSSHRLLSHRFETRSALAASDIVSVIGGRLAHRRGRD